MCVYYFLIVNIAKSSNYVINCTNIFTSKFPWIYGDLSGTFTEH